MLPLHSFVTASTVHLQQLYMYMQYMHTSPHGVWTAITISSISSHRLSHRIASTAFASNAQTAQAMASQQYYIGCPVPVAVAVAARHSKHSETRRPSQTDIPRLRRITMVRSFCSLSLLLFSSLSSLPLASSVQILFRSKGGRSKLSRLRDSSCSQLSTGYL